jgi:hypothetical protein
MVQKKAALTVFSRADLKAVLMAEYWAVKWAGLLNTYWVGLMAVRWAAKSVDGTVLQSADCWVERLE